MGIFPQKVRALFAALGTAAHSPAITPEPPPDAAELRAFDAYILRMTHPAYERLLLLVLIVAIVWWPVDLLTEADNPARLAAFAWVRGLVAVVAALGWLLLRWSGPGPRTYLVFSCVAIGVHAILGAVMATLPGVSGLQFFYTLPLIAIVVPVPLRARVMLVGALFLAFWGAALVTGDQPLGEIGAPASFSFGAALASTLFGHWLRMLILVSHLNKLRLDLLKQTLEQRVATQGDELRALARSVVTARDEERAMLSRELHDAMGQELTAMRYGVAFAERRAREAGTSLPSGLGFAIGQLAELVARLNDTTKRLLLRMRPREVEQLGLARALESLVMEAQRQRAMQVTVDATPEVLGGLDELDTRTADVAFRALQEGLTNAHRHAPADAVRITLTAQGDALQLCVEDDGSAAAPNAGTRLGLIGVRERAGALGGSARWGPREGRPGFALQVTLPRQSMEVDR